MITVIKREDAITCPVCQSEGEMLTFDDGTAQVEHPRTYHEKEVWVTPVCKIK